MPTARVHTPENGHPNLHAEPERRSRTVSTKAVTVGGVGVGGILGVVILLHQFGIPPFGAKDGGAVASAAPAPSEGEAERPPKTSERVARVEVVLDAMKTEAKEARDEIVALKVEQRAVGVRVDGVKEQLDRVEADQRVKFDRLLDKLDDVASDVRRRRDR